MDDSSVGRLSRFLAGDGSRRRMLRRAATGAAGAALATIGLAGEKDGTVAKQKRKRPKCRPAAPLSSCTTNKDCCVCQTNFICGTVDTIEIGVCCGTRGAACTDAGQCCFGFVCNGVTGLCDEIST